MVSDIEFLQSFHDSLRTLEGKLDDLCQSDLSPADGLPTTSKNEERCARIADSHGFDGSLFRNLFAGEDFDALLRQLRKRIKTIPRIIAAIEKQEKEPTPQQTEFALKPIDIQILDYLATQTPTRTQVEIEAATGISKKTIGQRLAKLREAGLTERPSGDKGGEKITTKGRTKVTPNLLHKDAQR